MKYTNLQSHDDMALLDKSTLDTNWDIMHNSENLLYPNSVRDPDTHTAFINLNTANFSGKGYASRHGEWAYIGLVITPKKVFPFKNDGGLIDVTIGQLDQTYYKPAEATVMTSYEGKWARALIQSNGDIWLKAMAVAPTTVDSIKFATYIRLSNVTSATTPAYVKEGDRFSCDNYGFNMDKFDEATSKANGGNIIYDPTPVGIGGFFVKTTAVDIVEEAPSFIMRNGDLVFIALNFALNSDLKSNSGGGFDRKIFTIRQSFIPKHTIGLFSAGHVDGISGDFSARVTASDITLTNSTMANYTYKKGTRVTLRGMLMLKDK